MRFIATTAVYLSVVLTGACQYWEEETDVGAAARPSYREVAVAHSPMRIAVTANGVVKPIDRIELKSKASGEIIELPVEVGDLEPG